MVVPSRALLRALSAFLLRQRGCCIAHGPAEKRVRCSVCAMKTRPLHGLCTSRLDDNTPCPRWWLACSARGGNEAVLCCHVHSTAVNGWDTPQRTEVRRWLCRFPSSRLDTRGSIMTIKIDEGRKTILKIEGTVPPNPSAPIRRTMRWLGISSTPRPCMRWLGI